MSKIDVAARLEGLAGEIRGEGEWPKFTHIADGIVFEYSSRCRWRAYFQGSWGPWDESPGSAWMNIDDETPIPPAEAARLTGGGVERCEVLIERDDWIVYKQEGEEFGFLGALESPSFIGFVYENGDIDVSPRLYAGEFTPARVPVAVLFAKE